MIKIFCLYFEGKYTPDYIEKLYNGLKKHCKVPFEFVCYSDTKVVADKVIPLPKDTIIQQHWHKLSFFNKAFTGDGDIVVLDIDQVIVSNITDMIGWPVNENELVSYQKWWTKNINNTTINGGWYKFKAGSLQYVYDKYMTDPDYWQLYYYNNGMVHYKYFGEQNFVEDTVRENTGLVTHMPGQWVAKYDNNDSKINAAYQSMYCSKFNKDFMILGDEIDEDIKIVHFANFENTVHGCNEDWVKQHWV